MYIFYKNNIELLYSYYNITFKKSQWISFKFLKQYHFCILHIVFIVRFNTKYSIIYYAISQEQHSIHRNDIFNWIEYFWNISQIPIYLYDINTFKMNKF
jgi:hypothetical protein